MSDNNNDDTDNNDRIPIDRLRVPAGGVSYPPQYIKRLAAELKRQGFLTPIVIDPRGNVMSGAGLLLAAKHLGVPKVPVLRIHRPHLDSLNQWEKK